MVKIKFKRQRSRSICSCEVLVVTSTPVEHACLSSPQCKCIAHQNDTLVQFSGAEGIFVFCSIAIPFAQTFGFMLIFGNAKRGRTVCKQLHAYAGSFDWQNLARHLTFSRISCHSNTQGVPRGSTHTSTSDLADHSEPKRTYTLGAYFPFVEKL